MIPNGLNPHGLEKRELRFHIYNNGAEEIVSTFETSLYCYATFPPEIMSTYGSGWAL